MGLPRVDPPPAPPVAAEPGPIPAAAAAAAAAAELAAEAAAAAAVAAAPEDAAQAAAGCVGASSWLSPLLPLPELSIRKGLRSKRNTLNDYLFSTTEAHSCGFATCDGRQRRRLRPRPHQTSSERNQPRPTKD